MTIGEKITQRRLAAHLSQEILAERLGVSTQDVSRWESGEVLPDAEKLLQLCRVFGLSADESRHGLYLPSATPSLVIGILQVRGL